MYFKKSVTACLLFTCLLLASASYGQERYLKPVDEAAKDASFLKFREELIKAVKNKNAAFIYSILDPRITNSFGGNSGIPGFKRMWKLNAPNTKFWEEFEFVITHGGAFQDKNTFVAPYVFSSFPKDVDDTEHEVIVGENVRLREKPDSSSETLTLLSYNIVKTDYTNSIRDPKNEEKLLWLKIETLGGKKGYVAPQYVRSSLDYRAGFAKKRGKWKMTFFVAGD